MLEQGALNRMFFGVLCQPLATRNNTATVRMHWIQCSEAVRYSRAYSPACSLGYWDAGLPLRSFPYEDTFYVFLTLAKLHNKKTDFVLSFQTISPRTRPIQ